jgi:hypothetical protein
MRFQYIYWWSGAFVFMYFVILTCMILFSAYTLLLLLDLLQILRPLLLKQVGLRVKIMIATLIMVDCSTGTLCF